MRSAAKLNYAQAQAAIDGRPDDTTGPLLEPILKPLYTAYALVNSRATARSARSRSAGTKKFLLKTRRVSRSRHRARSGSTRIA